MTISELQKKFMTEAYYGTTKSFQEFMEELLNKIDQLEDEIIDIKYRYEMRKDIEE